MGLVAHDGADRADQLLGVTERLTTLIKNEIDALKLGKLDASTQEWAEKEKLAHAYRLEIAAIQKNPGMLEGATKDQRETLKKALVDFQNTLEIHSKSLSAMKEVTEGLVQAISKEVASTRGGPAAYGAAGQVAPSKTGAQGVAFNAQA